MLIIPGYNTPSEQPSVRSMSPMDTEVDARRSLPSQVATPEDLEKETKTPTQTHPAYHPLPGRSPDTPTWQSQIPITPMTPNTPYTPQQTQHPAYHVHKLSQHPAFNPRSSPPRSQPPMWKHPAFRPGSNTAQLDSTPIIPQNELEGFSFKRPRNASISTLPRSLSSKELPAEVPRTFPPGGSSSDPNMISRFNQQANTPPGSQPPTPGTPKKYRPNVLSREASTKTGISTYTIPIGLGVVDGSPTIGTKPFDLPTPTDHELTPKPLRPQTPPPPMKANMNEREDHIMSWSAYGAGNLSGIGPSNSIGSERTRRQREIEQGIIARELRAEKKATMDADAKREAERWSERNGLGKKEVWMNASEGRGESGADVPETPLSAYRESWMERDSWIRR
jgi:hypothetical protein